MRKAVILFNLGGPDKLENVKPFLFNLFNDPAILNLPSFFRYPLAKLISNRREPAAKKIYQELGGSSPILKLTEEQSKALELKLNNDDQNSEYKCFIVMRCWHPRAEEVLHHVRNFNPDEIILMPLYPQYCAATTGSTFDAVSMELQQWRWVPSLRFIGSYFDQPLYIEALKNSIEEFWSKNEKPKKLLFSYHGIPKKYLDKGDPYHCYCHKTTRLISEKFNSIEMKTTFQSRFGPQEWLQPYTDKTLENLPKEGKKNILTICLDLE